MAIKKPHYHTARPILFGNNWKLLERTGRLLFSKQIPATIVRDARTLHFDSALDWLVDQSRFKTDERYGITHDPNAAFDEDGLVRLIKQVTHVSVETVGVVEGLGVVESS